MAPALGPIVEQVAQFIRQRKNEVDVHRIGIVQEVSRRIEQHIALAFILGLLCRIAARLLHEVVELAHREPGKLNYGSFGIGSQPHLAFSLINRKQGTDQLHVPYKGIAPLMNAVTAGEVMLASGTVGVAGELMKAGKLKGLAIAGKQRSALFPSVPTTGELGFPELQVSIWFGLFTPAGTPQSVVDRIGDDARAILRSPAFIERHLASRYDVVASSAADLGAAIRDETAAVAEMIRAAGVVPE